MVELSHIKNKGYVSTSESFKIELYETKLGIDYMITGY